MDIKSKIDYKDLKKQKNSNKKQFKKAIKQKDYDMIQQCLKFVEKYDEMLESDSYKQKYMKYYNQLPVDTKEIIRLRKDINELKQIDLQIMEIFEERLIKKMTKHLNQYTERRLIEMKKQLVNANRQVSKKTTVRMKGQQKVKKMNIS